MLDAWPVRKGETRLEVIEDRIGAAEDPVRVDDVRTDRSESTGEDERSPIVAADDTRTPSNPRITDRLNPP